MYNLFQYVNKQHQQQQSQKKIDQQTSFTLRHEQFKKQAYERMKQKANQFLFNQFTSKDPFVFEDDHYQNWRKHKLYRDVENSEKMMGFKTFRHRPNQDMDKFYSSRERKQIQYLADKKENLVKSGILDSSQVSRSQRSQGPYNPKIEFRLTKKDEEYLQPRLRFTNITDRQRANESAMHFDERVSKIYSKFQASKSRLGKAVRSTRYYDQTNSGVHLSSSQRKSVEVKKSFSPQGYEQPEEKDLSMFKSTKMSNYIEQRNHSKRKEKTYFKLSKTMQMLHPDKQKRMQFNELMKKSQYDRTKNLSNIQNNTFYENYQKDAIV